MVHTKPQRKQMQQFTHDDVARIVASALNNVLDELSIQHIVEGIAIFPAGEGVFLVDMVMLDLETRGTWNASITIPPAKEDIHGQGS